MKFKVAKKITDLQMELVLHNHYQLSQFKNKKINNSFI